MEDGGKLPDFDLPLPKTQEPMFRDCLAALVRWYQGADPPKQIKLPTQRAAKFTSTLPRLTPHQSHMVIQGSLDPKAATVSKGSCPS